MLPDGPLAPVGGVRQTVVPEDNAGQFIGTGSGRQCSRPNPHNRGADIANLDRLMTRVAADDLQCRGAGDRTCHVAPRASGWWFAPRR